MDCTEQLAALYAAREALLERMAGMPAAGNHTWAVLSAQVDRLDIVIGDWKPVAGAVS